jgi:hypothetical protein
MKKNIFRIQIKNIACMGIIIACTACSKISSDEVEASSVFGEISVDRTESSGSVQTSATFYVGGNTGTVIELDSPANVKVNGASTSEITDPITNLIRYTRSVSIASPTVTVLYEDKEGAFYSNSISMPGAFSQNYDSGTVFKTQGFIIHYSSTNGFFSGEKIEVTLHNGSSSTYSQRALVTGAVTGDYSVSPSSLASLNSGALTIEVCRVSRPRAQQPYPKGTNISVKSCANSRTLNLQP